MAELKFIESFDDSEAIKELERIEGSLTDIIRASGDVQKTFNTAMSDMEGAAGEASASVEKLADETQKAEKAATSAQKANVGWASSLKSTVLGIQLGNKSLGEWAQQGQRAVSVGLNFAKSLATGSAAARVLKVALASTGIGLLLAAVGSLISYFGTFQKAVDKVKSVMAGLSGAVDAAKGQLESLGNVFIGVGKILSAPFSFLAGKNPITQITEGFAQAKKGALEFGAAVKDGFDIGQDIAEAENKLRDFELQNAVIANRRSIRAERFKTLAEDETKSVAERLRLYKLAFETEAANDKLRIYAANELLRITKTRAALGGIDPEEQAAINDAQISADNARAEAAQRRVEYQKTVNGLLAEEAERAEAARKKYEQLLGEVEKRTAALSTKNIADPVERLIAEWQGAVIEAEKIGEQLAAIAPDALAKAEAEKQVGELMDAINLKYTNELVVARFNAKKLREALTIDLAGDEATKAAQADEAFLLAIAPSEKARAEVKKRYAEIYKEIGQLVKERQKELSENRLELPGIDSGFEKKITQQFTDSVLAALENGRVTAEKKAADVTESILLKVAEVFKLRGKNVIDKKEAAAIFESLNGAFDNALDGFKNLSDAKISAIDREIEAIDKLIEATTTSIDEQKRLKELGLSNEYEIEKRKLTALQKQRDDADKKRLAEQKKVANLELLLDAARQASSLTTAATKIIAAESNKGLLGVVFAISAIAAMFAIVAQARANAAKFAAPKLRRGMKLKGRTHEEGGEALHVEGARYEAERDEWLIGTEPSKEHDTFLGKLNEGKYRGLDLGAAAERARADHMKSPAASAPVRHERLGEKHRAVEQARTDRALKSAVEKSAADIVEAVNSRPVIYPWKSGYKEKKIVGNIKETLIYQPE